MKKFLLIILSAAASLTMSGCMMRPVSLMRQSRDMLDSPIYREMLGDEAVDEALKEYDEQWDLLKDELDLHHDEIIEEIVSESEKEGLIKNDVSESIVRAAAEGLLNSLFAVEPESVDYSSWAYKAGDYFTDDYRPCKVHDTSAPCKDYYYDGETRIELHAKQCFGFAEYAQYEMYGKTSKNDPSYFLRTESVDPHTLTADKLEELVNEAGIGAHIRTGNTSTDPKKPNNHSMIITEITADGFSIIQCNGRNNYEYGYTPENSYEKCRIGTYTYTWESYVDDSYGDRGIDYIEYYDT